MATSPESVLLTQLFALKATLPVVGTAAPMRNGGDPDCGIKFQIVDNVRESFCPKEAVRGRLVRRPCRGIIANPVEDVLNLIMKCKTES